MCAIPKSNQPTNQLTQLFVLPPGNAKAAAPSSKYSPISPTPCSSANLRKRNTTTQRLQHKPLKMTKHLIWGGLSYDVPIETWGFLAILDTPELAPGSDLAMPFSLHFLAVKLSGVWYIVYSDSVYIICSFQFGHQNAVFR